MTSHALLGKLPFRTALASFSALDQYLNKSSRQFLVLSEGGLVDLVKHFASLEFSRSNKFDARCTTEDGEYYFVETDEIKRPPRQAVSVLDWSFGIHRAVYYDPYGVYPSLREGKVTLNPDASPQDQVLDAAIVLARYGFELDGTPPVWDGTLDLDTQRMLLKVLLEGEHSWRGFEVLDRTGFLESQWPVLHRMKYVDQAKEFHPEGDVWQHTLETLKYRKRNDPILSLALLLHDVGKPDSEEVDGNKFHRHAQIGAGSARRFLQDLQFTDDEVRDVEYLVRNHMVPNFLTALPSRTLEDLMLNPRFGDLLELYRCDLSSSFRGPDPYYEACRFVKSFRRNLRNPYRGVGRRRR